MLRNILAISGRPGLYRLVSRGRGNLIVESLVDGRRRPAYQTERVSALGDIAIYTVEGDDRPLGQVLEAVRDKAEGKPLDVKALGDDHGVRQWFAAAMPDFDPERVRTADIRKLLSWYNILLGAGITEYVEKEEEKAQEAEDKEQGAEK